MLTIWLVLGSLLVSFQAPAQPAACTVLTAQEVTSLVGAATTLPVTSSPTGSTCMFQKGDAIVTVLVADLDSADAAKGLWTSKQRIAAGQDVAGWPTPAYAGTVDQPKQHVAIVGVVKNKRFIEAKVIDASQPTATLASKLSAVMKALAGRM